MENLRVVLIVETPFQFFEVSVQTLDADFVERTDDGTLEQAPHAFNRVGVNLPDNPLLGRVLYSFMMGVRVP